MVTETVTPNKLAASKPLKAAESAFGLACSYLYTDIFNTPNQLTTELREETVSRVQALNAIFRDAHEDWNSEAGLSLANYFYSAAGRWNLPTAERIQRRLIRLQGDVARHTSFIKKHATDSKKLLEYAATSLAECADEMGFIRQDIDAFMNSDEAPDPAKIQHGPLRHG